MCLGNDGGSNVPKHNATRAAAAPLQGTYTPTSGPGIEMNGIAGMRPHAPIGPPSEERTIEGSPTRLFVGSELWIPDTSFCRFFSKDGDRNKF